MTVRVHLGDKVGHASSLNFTRHPMAHSDPKPNAESSPGPLLFQWLWPVRLAGRPAQPLLVLSQNQRLSPVSVLSIRPREAAWKEVLPGLIRRHPLAISSWVNWVYTITISRFRVIPLLFTFQSLAKSVLEEGGWSSLIVSISLVLTLNPEALRGTRARGRMERSEAPNPGWGMAMERGDGRRKMNRWSGYFCLDIFINTSKG